ncbi:MAG: hypothetical protein SF066_08135 [Thermoanaerobaculia bacterium]|nr:hypothetical protein [Thermoanaerobaculia bacterium]
MKARRLAIVLALATFVSAGSVSAETPRRELGAPESHGVFVSPSLLDRLERWLESWLLATETPPVPDPDERPTEGPQSDPNG